MEEKVTYIIAAFGFLMMLLSLIRLIGIVSTPIALLLIYTAMGAVIKFPY